MYLSYSILKICRMTTSWRFDWGAGWRVGLWSQVTDIYGKTCSHERRTMRDTRMHRMRQDSWSSSNRRLQHQRERGLGLDEEKLKRKRKGHRSVNNSGGRERRTRRKDHATEGKGQLAHTIDFSQTATWLFGRNMGANIHRKKELKLIFFKFMP